MEQYIHKIHGINDKTSLNVVIPHNIVEHLRISRGDFVEINQEENKIIIKKLETKEND